MAQEKQTRQKRRGRKYWQEQVRKLSISGLSIAAYSREYGVKAERLYKWRKRINRKLETKRFVELPVFKHPTHIGESYDIYVLPAPHIRIGTSFNPETLKQLIEMLRGL